MISTLILTKNEEQDLPGCLERLAWCDDVHVLDSVSTDRTCELAVAQGARISVRSFDDYARQRNHGLGLPFRHPWLLIVDADERIPAGLVAEMQQRVVTAPPELVAFRIRRRDFLFGRWLKHVQATPRYIRLVRPSRVEYTSRMVNEVLVPRDGGIIGDLREPFDHYPFSKGFDHWFDKHNRYARLEAEQILAERAAGVRFSLRQALFARDLHVRRMHQKGVLQALPFRPLTRFLLLYVLRGGFLDGRAGLVYAQLQACYERMIVAKLDEAAHQRAGR